MEHNMYGRRSLLAGLATVGTGVLISPMLGSTPAKAATNSAPNLAQLWNRIAILAIKRTNMNPPVAARALAILHTCIYDAWALYDRKALPTIAKIARQTPNELAKREAISLAAHTALVDLFPSEQGLFNDLLSGLSYQPPKNPDLFTAAGIGILTARAVLDERHNDGSNQLGDLHNGAYSDYTNYKPVNTPDQLIDPDHWQPLRLTNKNGEAVTQPFIVPHWQRVKPFALASANQFRPAAPYRSSSIEFRRQCEELVAQNANLTDREKLIVEYWADGPNTATPAGHWCLLAEELSNRDSHDHDRDVVMYFVLTNALFDSSIAAWDTKRTYDAVRPYSAIRMLFATTNINGWGGQFKGTVAMPGADWKPYQQNPVYSPPHPEYVSGHSTFSASAAEILRRFSGSDRFGAEHTQPGGTCNIEPCLVPARTTRLSWPTFTAAAKEAGLSRRLGGIHFLSADIEGQKIGRKVADLVWKRAITFIQGTATV